MGCGARFVVSREKLSPFYAIFSSVVNRLLSFLVAHALLLVSTHVNALSFPQKKINVTFLSSSIPEALKKCLHTEYQVEDTQLQWKWDPSNCGTYIEFLETAEKLWIDQDPAVVLLIGRVLVEALKKNNSASQLIPSNKIQILRKYEKILEPWSAATHPLAADLTWTYIQLSALLGELDKASDRFEKNAALLWAKNNETVLMDWLLEKYKESNFDSLKRVILSKTQSARNAALNGNENPKVLRYQLINLGFDFVGKFPKNKNQFLQSDLYKSIRKLWLAYPSEEERLQIRDFLSQYALSNWFTSPRAQELSIQELFVLSRGQVRTLDSNAALHTIRRFQSKPNAPFGSDEQATIWDAFQFHIRILRILDRRHEIPDVISIYLKRFSFLTLAKSQKKPADYALLAERLLSLARSYWTYGSPDVALEYINKVVALNRELSPQSNFSLAPALYIRARILENQIDKTKAFSSIEEALAQNSLATDTRDELLWRRYFLKLDQATFTKTKNQIQEAIQYLKALREKSNTPADRAKWNYWMGRTFSIGLNQGESIKHFKLSYEDDPLSFYSNLSGLELLKLGQSPKRWTLLTKPDLNEIEFQQPDWSNFKDSKGFAKDIAYNPLIRSLELARLGDFPASKNALLAMEGEFWKTILSSKYSNSKRRNIGHAMTWLRSAIADYSGALSSSEAIRQAFGYEMEDQELLTLYPWPHRELILKWAESRKIDPILILSLIRQESAFNEKAKSSANALGLMQMIPPVAIAEAKALKLENFQPTKLYNPDVAVQLGSYHLSKLVKQFQNSWICAIASYNAGTPPVNKWLDLYQSLNADSVIFIERISFIETKNYVKSILRNYINYQRLYFSPGTPPPLSPERVSALDIHRLLVMPPYLPGQQQAL